MTPEQAKAATGIQTHHVEFLSHFAVLCRESKEKYVSSFDFPFCDAWFDGASNEYNPGLAYAAMGICLTGYENQPSNQYRYIQASLAQIGGEDIDITSFYHLNDENYIASEDNVNVIAYALAHKKVQLKAGERDLVIIEVRGTSVSPEWNSNSDVANSVADGEYDIQYHEGFLKSAQYAYDGLKKYVVKHSLDPETSLLWIIGHSRGATICNDLAAMVDEDEAFGFAKDRVFAYTFASSTTTRRDDAHSEKFDNIFNVMNPEDYIPRLPPCWWDFKTFGQDLYLPSINTNYVDYRAYRTEFLEQFQTWTHLPFPAFHGNAQTCGFERMLDCISPNAADMYCRERFTQSGTVTFAQYFRVFTQVAGTTGKQQKDWIVEMAKYGLSVFKLFVEYFVKNEILGHDAPGAHQEEGYLGKLMLCYEKGIDITTPEKRERSDTRRFTVYGPVEVTVRDGHGRMVAHIKDGKRDEDLYDTDGFIGMYTDKLTGANQVWIPTTDDPALGAPFTLELAAEKDGTYDCTVADLTPMGQTLRQELYADVPLGREAVKWDDVRPDAPTHVSEPGDGLNVDVTIDGSCPDGTLLNGWAPYGDSIMGFSKDEVVADVLTARDNTYGDHVMVQAFHGHHVRFRGWWAAGADPSCDEPLCTDEKYVFRITEDTQLVALFEKA